jgi:hypothetical protein
MEMEVRTEAAPQVLMQCRLQPAAVFCDCGVRRCVPLAVDAEVIALLFEGRERAGRLREEVGAEEEQLLDAVVEPKEPN